MKIADSQSIKTGEREMILSIMKKIDPQVLAAIAAQNLSPDGMEFVDGDMDIVDNRIVYKMNLKVTVAMAVMFDRDGNLVGADLPNEEVSAGSSEDEGEIIDLVDVNDSEGNFAEEEPLVLADEVVMSEEGLEEVSDDSEPENLDAIIQKNKNFWSRRSDEAGPNE
ncbi:MAG: hypothetical protein WC799_04835 [Desulfobacteraceae bacterium]